jgi:selenocysteine-specific elongation factor
MRVVDGFARLRLERPVLVVPDDRFIVRDPGPSVVVGSLEVLDVDPPPRLDLNRLRAPVVERVFLTGPWRERRELGPLTGLDDATLDQELGRLAERGVVIDLGRWLVRADVHEDAVSALVEAVAARAQPLGEVADTLGLTREQVRSLAEQASAVTLDQNVIRHRDAADTAETPAGRAVLEALRAAPFAPPDPRNMLDDPQVLAALVREGAVIKCDEIWFASDALARAAQLVDAALATTPQLTVSDLRDLFGSSRKYTIAIVGWLDATGITRRQGDQRVRGTARVPSDPLTRS